MAGRLANPDASIVNDYQAPGEVFIPDGFQEPRQRRLSFFYCGRPNAQADHAAMLAEGEHSQVRKVLIKSEDNGPVLLRPGKHLLIVSTLQADVHNMRDAPLRTAVLQPSDDFTRYILIEQDVKPALNHG